MEKLVHATRNGNIEVVKNIIRVTIVYQSSLNWEAKMQNT
jgi:hypothetical protein